MAFGEADPTVLTVYFLAFGFWTAAAGDDFISSTWRSVRETRRKGKVHVVFVSIPMIYICVYIYFQYTNKDYKEMGAALLALTFALLHLARTFMGLWQLHMFKQWAISCIKSMESLGYETRLPEKTSWEAEESDSDDDEDSSSIETESEHDRDADESSSDNEEDNSDIELDRQWFQAFLQWAQSLTIFPEERARIKKLADDILVNETLIDNRLSDVHTVCKFRLFSREERRNMKKTKSTFSRFWLCLRYGSANALRGILILFSLSFQKSPGFPNTDSAPRLVPKLPESIWLNWATALVAQAGWTIDKFADTDPEPSAADIDVRKCLAAQVLLSAALHTQRMGMATTSTPVVNSSDARSAQDSSTKCLGFQDWYKYPKLCEGMFSKQEFLERACKTGSGLPYQARHTKAVGVKEGGRWYGYSSFESELRRAREALPPEIETRMKKFDVEQLEWFAIFVSVENWAPRSPSHGTLGNVPEDAVTSTSDFRSAFHSVRPAQPREAVNETDVPIQNLKAQLNFEKLPDFSLEHSKLGRKFDSSLWGNRNVLEASCHIDNWISISTGEEASEMLQRKPEVEKKWFSGRALYPSFHGTAGADILDKIIQESEKLERGVVIHRTGTKAEHLFFDLSVTFLGCSMEMLRSSLAKWAEKNEGGDEGSWKPSLFPTDTVRDTGVLEILDPFTASADFMSCLQSLRSSLDLSKRFVKMRVLWELQNQFHTHLPKEGVAPSRREAMALCILSFPAVSVDPVRMKNNEECVVDLETGDEELLRIDDFGYIIRPCLGPQDLKLCVSFKGREDNSKVEILTRICETRAGRVNHFNWEMWRNAFYGRLEGRRRWKKKNLVDSPEFKFSFIPPTYRISSGVNAGVWNYSTTWVPVEYDRADLVWLKNASLAADELLQAKFGSNGQREAQSTLERAEMLLKQDSDTDAELALQLIQVSAVHERNTSALEKAIGILLHEGRREEAVGLLEVFYSYGKHGEGQKQKSSGHVYSFFRNENYVNKIKFLFKEILKAKKLDEDLAEFYSYEKRDLYGEVVECYHMFLVLSLVYGEAATETVELLSDSIDEMDVGDATICFAFLLEKGRCDVKRDLPRAIELYEKGIDRGDPNAMYNLAVILCNGKEGAEQDIPRAMKLFETLIDVYREVNAMIKLADLLVQGEEGFPKNLPRAVQLYARAVDEDADGSVEAMEKLADIFRIGGDGVEVDVERAVSLEGESTSAWYALSNII